MTDNSHETTGYDDDSNLNSDSILRSALELLNLEMLLHSYEKELDQSSFLVKCWNFRIFEMLGIGEKVNSHSSPSFLQVENTQITVESYFDDVGHSVEGRNLSLYVVDGFN